MYFFHNFFIFFNKRKLQYFLFSTKKWATPTRSCLPIRILLVSKQWKTARSILRISYNRKNPRMRKIRIRGNCYFFLGYAFWSQ